jgi:N-acetylmuramoyl-L-alanine amidase
MGVVVAAQASTAATLRAVRQIIAPASTRLIIELSEPVHYRLQRIAARRELGVPARLYIDFLDTRLATALPSELPGGPLLRLRASQRDATTTRLILDVPGLSDFGCFPIPDPFRLVVDVRGTPRAVPRRSETLRAETRRNDVARAAPRPQPVVGTAPPSPALPQRHLKVVLDPGHGGKDPGALSRDGVAEKDITLSIARHLKTLLAAPDIDVVLTRDSDAFLALEERTARANAEEADLFISIHANASPNRYLSGVETYYLNNTNDRATIRLAQMENGLRGLTGHDGGDREVALILSDLIQSYKIQESVALAETIQDALVGALDARGTPVNNLGVKRGPFYVLVGAGMPCVLVEVSFVTNPLEGARLAQPSYREAIAEGLLRGIRRFVENARVAENL